MRSYIKESHRLVHRSRVVVFELQGLLNWVRSQPVRANIRHVMTSLIGQDLAETWKWPRSQPIYQPDELAQKSRNSSTLAVELHLSCIIPSNPAVLWQWNSFLFYTMMLIKPNLNNIYSSFCFHLMCSIQLSIENFITSYYDVKSVVPVTVHCHWADADFNF